MKNTTLIPKLVERVWRKACDDVIAEHKGLYSYKGGMIVQVYFHDLPSSGGKSKVSLIASRIPPLLAKAKEDISVLDKQDDAGAGFVATQKKETAPDMAKLLKEGLGNNPTLEVFRLWASRTLQDLTLGQQKTPLTRDMMDVAIKADVHYAPWWTPASGTLLGSIACVQGSVPVQQYNTGEALRQDVAALFSACFQIYAMQSKGQNGLMIVPVRATTLADKDVLEIYTGLLRRLSPEVKKNLMIEMKGMSKDSVPSHIVAAITGLALQLRGFVFETGILTYADYSRNFPKLHACGFDVSEGRLSEEEQIRLIKKYADHYNKLGIKTYIKGVAQPPVLAAAVASGFFYISGTHIKPLQKSCFTLQKLLVG